jgi:hypothetical protein
VNYTRLLNLSELPNKNSVILLGPRQVGKSTLVQAHQPTSAMMYNLAEADTFPELSAAQGRFVNDQRATPHTC